MIQEFSLQTDQKISFIDITEKIQAIIAQGTFEEGGCTVFIPHTTAGVTINENADPDVIRDITAAIEKMIPDHLVDFKHDEGNSPAHIKSSFFGTSTTCFFSKKTLLLGTWQSIYFCEFDGPRKRKVIVRLSN